ncbi:HTH domain-containing protein [Salinilacihabitans rarus]|uniref:HTH domain-containing protein n=1 Tax=Salinilacihabitans rarus TaxID=2961596 RepID=UPI0020C86B93|nr:HTH domain-containing protein [Salinilacihabitans rarus]
MYERTPSPKTVELWLRSFAPAAAGPNHERALAHLERLESRPEVTRVDVGVWGAEVEWTPRTERISQLRTIRSRLEAFDAWADRTDRSLEPFFRERHVESTITGESYDVRRLPTLAVAEYRGGELVHVAPSRDGEAVVDALDRLDALARGEADDPVLAYGHEPGGRDDSDPDAGERLEPASPR